MEKVICTNCGSDNSPKFRYCKDCGHELPKNEFQSEEKIDVVNDENKKFNKKNLNKSVTGIVTFLVTFLLINHFFFKSSNDKEMMAIASEINKSCPVMIDTETRLDNTIALPNKVFQYNYTLVNKNKSELDTLSVKKILEPNIVNQVKTNPQMQYQRDHKWTLNYYYKDKYGLYLLMVIVTPEKYAE